MRKITFIFICFIILSNLFAHKIILEIDKTSKNKILIEDNKLEILKVDDETYEIVIDEHQIELFDNIEHKFIDSTLSYSRDIENYRTYDELVSELQQIATENPDIVVLENLGPTTAHQYYLDGNMNYEDYQHEIYSLKLSDNPDQNEDEPNIYYGGAIHAREPISLEVTMYILHHLIDGYNEGDQEIIDWINSMQIWFFPLINPDGHKVVIDNTNLMYRKNLCDNNDDGLPSVFSQSGGTNTAYTVDGVDLNRNWGYVWGSNGTSSNPTSALYNGTEAWSEVETTYLRDILRNHKFYAGITYHSYGEYVLFPLGHLPGACALDFEVMQTLADSMAITIPQIDGTGFYDARQAVDFGYTCQGTMGDWGYAEQRIFSLTIELGNTYIPTQVDQICEDNLEAALILLDRIKSNTITGKIQNGSGSPLIAEIIVQEIDYAQNMSEVEPVKSDEAFGRFYRLLNPGTYNLLIHHDDYQDIILNDIIVTESGVTDLGIITLSADGQTQPKQVENIVISVSDEEISLNWDPVLFDINNQPIENVNYKIYQSNLTEVPINETTLIAETSTTFFIVENENNKTLFFRIIAEN